MGGAEPVHSCNLIKLFSGPINCIGTFRCVTNATVVVPVTLSDLHTPGEEPNKEEILLIYRNHPIVLEYKHLY